jgi:hypothetical protein
MGTVPICQDCEFCARRKNGDSPLFPELPPARRISHFAGGHRTRGCRRFAERVAADSQRTVLPAAALARRPPNDLHPRLAAPEPPRHLAVRCEDIDLAPLDRATRVLDSMGTIEALRQSVDADHRTNGKHVRISRNNSSTRTRARVRRPCRAVGGRRNVHRHRSRPRRSTTSSLLRRDRQCQKSQRERHRDSCSNRTHGEARLQESGAFT